MSKRIKKKEVIRGIRPRGPKQKTFESIKRSSSLVLVEDNSSDDDFQKKAAEKVEDFSSMKKNTKIAPKITKTKRGNVYEISDSSDDEAYKFSSALDTGFKEIDLHNLKRNPFSNIVNTSDNVLEPSKDSAPSSSGAAPNFTDFVDNLLETNKDLLNGSYGKTFEEMSEETCKLLTSNIQLFNETSPNLEDSVIYVCTDKAAIKPPVQEKLSLIQPTAGISPKKPDQQCPICLDTLGGDCPAWSTFCGHIFCKKCIEHWIVTNKNCPTCRKRLTTKKIHQLFFN